MCVLSLEKYIQLPRASYLQILAFAFIVAYYVPVKLLFTVPSSHYCYHGAVFEYFHLRDMSRSIYFVGVFAIGCGFRQFGTVV